MTTNFYFKPTITTAKMRGITKNEKFDYVLLCNKVCGLAHYMMNMKLVIDEPDDFREWLKGEKPVVEPAQATAEAPAAKPVASL
jgi:cytochrome c oxidase subunit 2